MNHDIRSHQTFIDFILHVKLVGPFVMPVPLLLHCCPVLPLSVASWWSKQGQAAMGSDEESEEVPVWGRL